MPQNYLRTKGLEHMGLLGGLLGPSLAPPWAALGPSSWFLASSSGFLGGLKKGLKQRVWSIWPSQGTSPGSPWALLRPPYTLLGPSLNPRRSSLVRPGVSGYVSKTHQNIWSGANGPPGGLPAPPGDPGYTPDAPKSSLDDRLDGPQVGPNDPK